MKNAPEPNPISDSDLERMLRAIFAEKIDHYRGEIDEMRKGPFHSSHPRAISEYEGILECAEVFLDVRRQIQSRDLQVFEVGKAPRLAKQIASVRDQLLSAGVVLTEDQAKVAFRRFLENFNFPPRDAGLAVIADFTPEMLRVYQLLSDACIHWKLKMFSEESVRQALFEELTYEQVEAIGGDHLYGIVSHFSERFSDALKEGWRETWMKTLQSMTPEQLAVIRGKDRVLNRIMENNLMVLDHLAQLPADHLEMITEREWRQFEDRKICASITTEQMETFVRGVQVRATAKETDFTLKPTTNE